MRDTDIKDLHAAADEYRAASQALAEHRAGSRDVEQRLMAQRADALRAIVGDQRGGIAAAARELGISDVQVLRQLGEDLRRVVTVALASVASPSDWELVILRGGRSGELRLPDDRDYPSDFEDDEHDYDHDRQALAERAAWVGRANLAGVVVTALQRAGIEVESDDDPVTTLASLDMRAVTVRW